MIEAHIELGSQLKKQKQNNDAITKFILETDSIKVKYLVNEEVYNSMEGKSQMAVITAKNVTAKLKEYGVLLKVYSNTAVTVNEKNQLITSNDLKTLNVINEVFPPYS